MYLYESKYFFDRFGGGVEPADTFTAHHLFGFGDFIAAIRQGGIFAAGPALFADLMQSFGLNGESEQLAAVILGMFWQGAD